MRKNIVAEKSIAFAIRVVKTYKFLCAERKEYVLSRQLLKSGTAIGALIREAVHAESKADFVHKLSIALKEANETDYWLFILKETEYLTKNEYESVFEICDELIRLLVTIIKTSKISKQNGGQK